MRPFTMSIHVRDILSRLSIFCLYYCYFLIYTHFFEMQSGKITLEVARYAFDNDAKKKLCIIYLLFFLPES